MARHKGKITPNGVVLEKHESKTVVFLTSLGFDVELIPPEPIKGIKTPDIKIGRLKWEIKCPKNNSKNTIEHAFRAALAQSTNIIFDLRRIKAPVSALKRAKNEFEHEKRAKRLMIITKSGEKLDFER